MKRHINYPVNKNYNRWQRQALSLYYSYRQFKINNQKIRPMKKVILATMLMAATWSLSAQVTVYRIESSGTNPAYSVPEYIRVNFETTHPDVALVTWAPAPDNMWLASYNHNNRMTRVYYNTTGEAYRVALPVISNQVPEEVITSAIQLYGSSLYDVTRMRAADNSEVYQVRLLENAVPRSVWMTADGVTVTTDIYKVKIDDEEMKIKTEEEKMKMKSDMDKSKTDL